MKIQKLLLSTLFCFGAASVQGQIVVTYDDLSAYNSSAEVLVPTNTLSGVSFIRNHSPNNRGGLQSFTVDSSFELTGIRIVADRMVEGAQADFSIWSWDDVNSAPGNNILPGDFSNKMTELTSQLITVTAANAAGFGTPGNWNAADSSVTWMLPDTVTLNPATQYFFRMEGTGTSNNPIVWRVENDTLTDVYTGGQAYYSSETTDQYQGQQFGDNKFDYSLALIPEPSTYAAIFGGLFLALALYRRRRA